MRMTLTRLFTGGVSLLLLAYFIWRLTRRRVYQLEGKVVLITGASSGLGACLAQLCSTLGAKVILAGRDMSRLNDIRSTLSTESLSIELDLNWNETKINDAVDTILKWSQNHLDVLINNAGRSYRGDILSTSMDVHREMMQVNYYGHLVLTRSICQRNISNNQSLLIVAISSIQGLLSQPQRSAYAASKHAFHSFHDCLRAELHSKDISVLTVAPGYIQTNLSLNAVTSTGTVYGKMDDNTAKGLSADNAAKLIVRGIEYGESEILLAPFHHKLATIVRRLCPALMFWIMNRRASS